MRYLMSWLLVWWRTARCIHTLKFVRNLHGDQINASNGNRSEWTCLRCGCFVNQPMLVAPDPGIRDAWGIIANVSDGDWSKQSPEWCAAAEHWRDANRHRIFV